jgi:hypothetical protein
MQRFQRFINSFNSVRKTVFLVASLTNFAPRQWLLHRMKIFFLLELHSLCQTYGNHSGREMDFMKGARSIQIPTHLLFSTAFVSDCSLQFRMCYERISQHPYQKECQHNLTGWWLTFECLSHRWCRVFPSHTLSFTLRFVMMHPNFICGED